MSVMIRSRFARNRGSAACAALVAVVALQPSSAHAYEDQQTLGVGLGYAQAVGDEPVRHGLSVDVTASSGLSAQWTLRGRLSYALHPRSDTWHVGIAASELLYVIDVVELVPYAGVGAGVVLRAWRSELDLAPAVHAVVGLDYLVSRSWTLEVDARAHALLTEFASAPLYWALTGSVVWMFDP